MSKPDGGPAFPIGDMHGEVGMSLRDYFAAAALQGMLAYSHVNPSTGNYHENCSLQDAAAQAYEYADAMIEARDK